MDKPEKPPALDINSFSSSTTATTYSPESYLPTPDDLLTSSYEDQTRGFNEMQMSRDRLHGRNRSYAYEKMPGEQRRRALAPQKSLPDLRTQKAHAQQPSRGRIIEAPVHVKKSSETFGGSLPESSRAAPPTPTPLADTPPLRTRKASQTARGDNNLTTSTSERRAPSMDVERNSYFRRLSTLPTASISAIPAALLSFVDSVRGILFAVSQIYQSLQHYTVYAIDERLSSVLQKVLDPASQYMLQLINALDSFDSMSRRGAPPPSVIKRVVESCRDNVSVFGKAVGVLALQLKVLASRDDVRYSRHMLLMLYGAMAEISNSWHGIAQHIDSIEPLLREEERPPLPLKLPTMTNGSKLHTKSQRTDSRERISPIAEQPESPSPLYAPVSLLRPIPTSRSTAPLPPPSASVKVPVGGERSRMARRHAGSFSVKDVELGRSMATNQNASPPADRPVNGNGNGSSTSTIRQHTRNLHPMMPPPVHPYQTPGQSPTKSVTMLSSSQSPEALHVRQDSSLGLLSPGVPSPGLRSNTLEVPTTLVDKDAIEAMAVAVRAAPAVWSMLEEISGDMPDAATDMRENLSKAETVTNRLGGNIKAIQEGLPNADRKALREDAHVFVRVCLLIIQCETISY